MTLENLNCTAQLTWPYKEERSNVLTSSWGVHKSITPSGWDYHILASSNVQFASKQEWEKIGIIFSLACFLTFWCNFHKNICRSTPDWAQGFGQTGNKGIGEAGGKCGRAAVWKSVGLGNRAFLGSVLSTAELHAMDSYRWQETGSFSCWEVANSGKRYWSKLLAVCISVV